MSKAIKIRDEVYDRLLAIQRPRETVSAVIDRALQAYETIQGIRDGLPAAHYLQERPKKEEAKAEWNTKQ